MALWAMTLNWGRALLANLNIEYQEKFSEFLDSSSTFIPKNLLTYYLALIKLILAVL